MQVDFDTFIAQLKKRLVEPLPGATAHEPLRAQPLGSVRPNFEHKYPPKPGAVMILLYPDGDQIKFPLTKRPDYVGTHGGQISLPGGKAEQNETVEQTALREAEEEIGIRSSSVKVIGRLSEFFVIPSNFNITPVIGFLEAKSIFTPDPVEVVKIIESSIDQLIMDDAIRTKEILVARSFQMMAPHFLIEDEIVWGATAMMLNEFRTVIKEILISLN